MLLDNLLPGIMTMVSITIWTQIRPGPEPLFAKNNFGVAFEASLLL